MKLTFPRVDEVTLIWSLFMVACIFFFLLALRIEPKDLLLVVMQIRIR